MVSEQSFYEYYDVTIYGPEYSSTVIFKNEEETNEIDKFRVQFCYIRGVYNGEICRRAK